MPKQCVSLRQSCYKKYGMMMQCCIGLCCHFGKRIGQIYTKPIYVNMDLFITQPNTFKISDRMAVQTFTCTYISTAITNNIGIY